MDEASNRERTPAELTRIQRFRQASHSCAALAALMGASVVTIWVARPELPAAFSTIGLMPVNAGLCLLTLALALSLRADGRGRRSTLGLAVLAVPLTIGVLTLIEHALGADFGINRLLARGTVPSLPTRMAPQMAAAVVLSVAGVLTMTRGDGVLCNLCDGSLIAVGLLLHAVMGGYFYHDDTFVGLDLATRMSPQALIGMSFIWTGTALARSDRGLSRLLSADGGGSDVIRYLLGPTALFPILIGCFKIWGQAAGWQSTAFAAAALATVQSILRVTIILGLGYLLNRAETQRRQERQRRKEAERMIAMCAWTRRVRWRGEWVDVDVFLKERFDLEITHGISEDALSDELRAMVLDEMDERAA